MRPLTILVNYDHRFINQEDTLMNKNASSIPIGTIFQSGEGV